MKSVFNLLRALMVIVAAMASLNGYSQSYFTNGLVAYYPFNGNGHDIIGGNDMVFVSIPTNLSRETFTYTDTSYTNSGNFTTNRLGQASGAVAFSGVNTSYARSANSINLFDNFTISVWAQGNSTNPVGYDADGCVLLWPQRGEYWGYLGVGLYMNRSMVSVYGGKVYSGSGGPVDLIDANITQGQWTHITVTCNNRVLVLYINGIPLGTNDQSSVKFNNTASQPFASAGHNFMYGGAHLNECGGIGGSAWVYDYSFNYRTFGFDGNVSDFLVYNRALTSDEVSQLYANQAPSPTPPSIISQPQNVLVNAHDNAAFSVMATGTYPLSYTWALNGANTSYDMSQVHFSTATLSLTNVQQSDLGAYTVIITNAGGSLTSSVANLSMYPYLEEPFPGLVTYWGQSNTLSVGAWGSGVLSYQWYRNGVAVPNATNSTLILPSIQFTNAGLYSVVVGSSLGSVTNTPQQVVVNSADVALGLFPGVMISGTVGYSYIIQSTTNLGSTNSWVTETNVTLNQPFLIWSDYNSNIKQGANPMKFYRVLPLQ